jgi:hypothetical protein
MKQKTSVGTGSAAKKPTAKGVQRSGTKASSNYTKAYQQGFKDGLANRTNPMKMDTPGSGRAYTDGARAGAGRAKPKRAF